MREDVDTILIGKNDRWKDAPGKDSVFNQDFVQLPHAMFIGILRTVARQYGISVACREESYTSQASFIDRDYIPTYGVDDDKASFSGVRDKSLYTAENGSVLHADVNGALNTLRKEKPDKFPEGAGTPWAYLPVEKYGFHDIYPRKRKVSCEGR